MTACSRITLPIIGVALLLAAGRPSPADATPAFPPLPTAVSSLGAVECDGYLYVYGGHAGKTHSYDTKTVIGTFHRLKLSGGAKWEDLPGGPIAQGMNLAAHGGKVYRVGGMQPRNAPGEPADNHSLTECARFDPKVGKWEPLPPLPAGRSSHDLVVAGDKLVVVGGWQMRGKGETSVWHDTALALDLTASKPEWKSIPQPFKRRALTAAAVGNKVYVVGGLGETGGDKRLDVLDVTTGKWTGGPDLPGADRVAFSPAACAVNGRLLVNTSEGPVYRLNAAGDGWEKVGEVTKKRIVARLIPFGNDAVLIVGGAGGGANVDALEVVRLTADGKGSRP
jgi:N-acetylneuraminic acid mutarotase